MATLCHLGIPSSGYGRRRFRAKDGLVEVASNPWVRRGSSLVITTVQASARLLCCRLAGLSLEDIFLLFNATSIRANWTPERWEAYRAKCRETHKLSPERQAEATAKRALTSELSQYLAETVVQLTWSEGPVEAKGERAGGNGSKKCDFRLKIAKA